MKRKLTIIKVREKIVIIIKGLATAIQGFVSLFISYVSL
ncbi:hypothetical protein CBNA_2133 (plasmid) [Coxiella burnetii str. Namibia]|nr:hypothetical protein CBNA_2133 [Coxiella burnetii str. Namibia]EAX32521.1 hypothetical protein A35_0015 [Coxiella burnetii 'MSU Goat Q177']